MASGPARRRISRAGRVRIRGGMLHNMSASLPSRKALGIKAYASVRGQTRFLIAVWDTDNGDLKALIEGDRLGQIRTGAASGVATRYLARADARILGMIGTGWQARSQVEAICAVRPIQQVRVFGRDPERRQTFADEMQRATGVETLPADSAEHAVRDAHVVATMTSSATRPARGVAAAGSTPERSRLQRHQPPGDRRRGGAPGWPDRRRRPGRRQTGGRRPHGCCRGRRRSTGNRLPSLARSSRASVQAAPTTNRSRCSSRRGWPCRTWPPLRTCTSRHASAASGRRCRSWAVRVTERGVAGMSS